MRNKKINHPIDLAPAWTNPEVSSLPIEGFRYTSFEFYEKEWNQMWTKVWLVAGRVDQLINSGDYITVPIGSESILCSVGSDNKIHAFYNVCQHRGNRLVSNENGSLNGGDFTCAYHGWRFNTERSTSAARLFWPLMLTSVSPISKRELQTSSSLRVEPRGSCRARGTPR